MARNSYKTYLMGAGASGSTYTKLCDIKEYPDLGQAPDGLETTTLSDAMKTYINDIVDPGGTLEFTANYDPVVYQSLQSHVGKREKYAIWLGGTADQDGVVQPDGSEGKFEFEGDLATWLKGAGTSAVVDMGIAISPSTPITFSYQG